MASSLTGPEQAKVRNPAFDVTPNRYVTAIVTERGVVRLGVTLETYLKSEAE